MRARAFVGVALSASLIALSLGSTQAGTHSLPVAAPIVSVDLPDEWNVETEDFTIEAWPRSEDMYVSYMLVSLGEFSRAKKTWEDWASGSQIKLLEEGKSVKKFQFEGGDSISERWNAMDSDGPTIVMRTILKLGESHLLFVTEYGAEAATRQYADELRAIRRSVTKRD